jgi:hypothetical protein
LARPSRHIALLHELDRYWSKADVVTSDMTPPALLVHGLVACASRKNLSMDVTPGGNAARVPQ